MAVPTPSANLPVAVIGAGPVGLAAAAHLLQVGLEPLVLEAGPSVAAAVRQWGHVRLFSPWRYVVDSAAETLLAATGWQRPDPETAPTGAELVRHYLEPLGAHPAIAPHLRFNTRVTAVTRRGADRQKDAGRDASPFALHVVTPVGEERVFARAVIDASGTYGAPNPLGGSGVPALGEAAAADHLYYGIPNRPLAPPSPGWCVAPTCRRRSAVATRMACRSGPSWGSGPRRCWTAAQYA